VKFDADFAPEFVEHQWRGQPIRAVPGRDEKAQSLLQADADHRNRLNGRSGYFLEVRRCRCHQPWMTKLVGYQAKVMAPTEFFLL
jgi:hypothetical protein